MSKTMRIIPKVILVVSIIFIIINIFMVNFDDLSWSVNKSAYMGIFSMVCVAISMVLSLKNR